MVIEDLIRNGRLCWFPQTYWPTLRPWLRIICANTRAIGLVQFSTMIVETVFQLLEWMSIRQGY